MTLTATIFSPFNVGDVARLVESDDGNVWFSAGEFGSTDVWFFDPESEAFTKVDSLGTGFPFDSLADCATDGAGTQFTQWRSGGEGPYAYRTYDNAGTRGADVPIPGAPFGSQQGAPFVYAGGYLVGANFHGGAHVDGAEDVPAGASIWSNDPSQCATFDCIGPDGQVYGRDPTGLLLTKVDPTTGVETVLYTSTMALGPVAADFVHLWTFDGTDVLVFDVGGGLVHNWGPLPVGFSFVTFCPRAADGLMYATGNATSGPNLPLYSIDPTTGAMALAIASMDATGTVNYPLAYSDGSTMYFGTSYLSSNGALIQVTGPTGNPMRLLL